ncbi:MAG TPA: ATP-binding protein, partial [Ktedonobacteraceae bacterium]|nr:ATP-binding protein [Ktedonobacteraceae bacterium]
KSVEVMGTIGQMAFEFTHRWDNGLGLVDSYINDIQAELESLGVCSQFIVKKLDNIAQATRSVLDFSKVLKQEFVRSGEATDATVLHPDVLFEKARGLRSLPPAIEMHMRIEEDVSMVEVIPNLVTDILYNLISNAIDAMSDGGKIVLRARNDGKFVALSISDTGSGITEQHIGKVFDLFYSTKGSYGFGLWSARRNALRNHGDLLVESEPGKGTTFTLLLPRVN